MYRIFYGDAKNFYMAGFYSIYGRLLLGGINWNCGSKRDKRYDSTGLLSDK
jgi:hypothetical protein